MSAQPAHSTTSILSAHSLSYRLCRRRALIDTAIGVPAGADPWYSVEGAVFADFHSAPPPAALSAAIVPTALIPPDAPVPDAALVAAVSAPLSSVNRALAAAAATVTLVLSQRWTLFHLPHRRALLGIRARVRLLRHYGLPGTGVPLSAAQLAALAAPDPPVSGSSKPVSSASSSGGAGSRKGNAAAASAAPTAAASGDGSVPAPPSAIAELLTSAEIASPAPVSAGGPGSGGGPGAGEPPAAAAAVDAAAPPALLRAVSLLAVPGFPGIPLTVQVGLTTGLGSSQ